jgi:RNA recognition motif-containing protein
MDIFAGSLPFKLSEEDLKKLFEQYGTVNSAKIIIDKITRQNKGFAFIEMPNEQEALLAIEALNGSEVMGRQIVVNKSEKKENRDSNKSSERKYDNNKSYNSGSSNSNESSTNNHSNNFGPNKVKGGGFKGNFNKGGFNKGKSGGSKGNKRDNYRDDNNYNY